MISYTDAQMEQERNDPKWLSANGANPGINPDLFVDLIPYYVTALPVIVTKRMAEMVSWMGIYKYRLHNGPGYKDGIAIEQKAVTTEDMITAAVDTLEDLNYTWNGGEFWKPPVSISGNNAPAWDGEGHPPDGTICEMAIANHTAYRIVLVDYIGIDICVFTIEESGKQGSCSINVALFRPIQSHKEKLFDLVVDSIKSTLGESEECLNNSVINMIVTQLRLDKLISMPEGDK